MDSIENIIESTKDLNILVVEDNEDAREQFVGMLENICNNITTAIDGQDGLEVFKSQSFDLIISDINMPKMDGVDMIKKIREIDTKIQIIVISAHNESVYLEYTKNLDIEGFLYKPLDIESFFGLMTKVIEKKNKQE